MGKREAGNGTYLVGRGMNTREKKRFRRGRDSSGLVSQRRVWGSVGGGRVWGGGVI